MLVSISTLLFVNDYLFNLFFVVKNSAVQYRSDVKATLWLSVHVPIVHVEVVHIQDEFISKLFARVAPASPVSAGHSEESAILKAIIQGRSAE